MLAKVSSRFGIHYGWLVVATIFLVLVTVAGVQAIPGIIILPLQQEFDWTRSAVSSAIAVSILLFGLGGPVSGRLIPRFGPRKLLVGALAVAAVSIASLYWLQSVAQLILVWGNVVGLSLGVLGLPLGVTIASRW